MGDAERLLMGFEEPDRPTSPADLRMDRAHAARVYDYYLGGKTHYEADREVGDRVMAAWPTVPTAARTNRGFMHRAARVLATEYGIDQFLDIGTGIPTEPNLHQVVQGENPHARVVYVDNDPLVLAHARALMDSTPQGRTVYLHASVTDPDSILQAAEVTRTLDLSRPVALSAVALMHFVPDELDAYGILGRFLAALPSGSALVLTHVTGDFDAESMRKVLDVYRSRGTAVVVRGKAEFARFFDGLDLIAPGIEVPHRWRPEAGGRPHIDRERGVLQDADVGLWAGIALKP